MRSRSVVVAQVRSQNASQVLLVQDDRVVEALSPDRADDSLHIRILPRGTWCNENLLDPESIDAAREVLAVDTIAVTDQIPG